MVENNFDFFDKILIKSIVEMFLDSRNDLIVEMILLVIRNGTLIFYIINVNFTIENFNCSLVILIICCPL
jgi:hypothetical protein